MKTLLKTGTILVLVSISAVGFLPVPVPGMLPVHDSIGNISWIITAGNTAATVARLQTIYNQAVSMSRGLSGTVSRWGAGVISWRQYVSPNTFGTNARWQNAMNSGADVPGSFQQIMTRVNTTLNNIPAAFQNGPMGMISAIERHDGLIQGNALVIGNYQAAQNIYQARVQALAAAATSDSASEQTYAALQQKGVAATMLQVQAQNVANELAKQSLMNSQAQLMWQREGAANDVNRANYFYSTVQATLNTANSATALNDMVIP